MFRIIPRDQAFFATFQKAAQNALDGAEVLQPLLHTLEDDTEYISYYAPPYDTAHEGGIRYNDPAFNIEWPIPISSVSEKDSSWPDFKQEL